MKLSKLSYLIAATLSSGVLSSVCAAGGPGVQASLMKLDWDPRNPSALPYQEFNIDSTVNLVLTQMWSQARESMHDNVVTALSAPNALKSGVTLYEIDLQLTASDPAGSLITSGSNNGTIRLSLPNNVMTFKARNSVTPGYADPKFRTRFDITIDIDLYVGREPSKAPIAISAATARLSNAQVASENITGVSIAAVTAALEAEFGIPSLATQMNSAIDRSSINLSKFVGNALNQKLRTMMAGYQTNGGRIENGRILIAEWQKPALPAVAVPVRAHWKASDGRLLANCDALEAGLTMAIAPPPFGSQVPVTVQYRPSAPSGSVQNGDEMACVQSLPGFQGVPATLQYRQAIGVSRNDFAPGIVRTLQVIATNLPSPIIGGDAARGHVEFTIAAQNRMHDGHNLLNQAARIQQPGDPAALTRRAALGDPAMNKRLAPNPMPNGGRTTAELNPQPLPPGPAVANTTDKAWQLRTAPAAATSPATDRNGIIIVGGVNAAAAAAAPISNLRNRSSLGTLRSVNQPAAAPPPSALAQP